MHSIIQSRNRMAYKLLIISAFVAAANAGLLSLGYGGGNLGGGNLGGGNLGGGSGLTSGGYNGNNGAANNYYNNAPLALNHGPLPQQNVQVQPVVAPLRYAHNPLPLATSSSSRHQISQSYPIQVPYATSGYNSNLGGGNNIGSNIGGYGLGSGLNNGNAGGLGNNGGYGY